MATKSENAEIAVLQTQMTNVEQTVVRIESKLDSQVLQSEEYIRRSEFEKYKKEQKAGNLMKIISTSIVTAVLAALVYLAFGVR